VVRVEGFVSDISERKRFEKVLGEERERLAVTLRAMAEGVVTTDRYGVVQYVNEAAEHLTGWAEGAAIGKKLQEVCVLRHERSRAEVVVPFDTAVRGEAVVELPRSTQLVDRQGGARLVEGRCAPIHDAESRPVGVVLVLRDVAERSRLEAEMARSSKLESLGVLAGGIAHDFNNLLTVILGNVTLTLMDRAVTQAAGRWLRDAELAAVRARELTHQLLTFAKGGDPVRATVRLGEVVREAADFALHGSRVRCEFTKSPDLWPADVDKGQIGQVVQNLVINAVQAMPDGGVIRIKLVNESHAGDPVRAIEAGPYLRLEIEDEGAGIRSEHLARIFDPYFTTKATGSGLGLAMVYSIVKKHDGHIEVDSEVGRGTRFTILLPALPTAEPVAPAPEAPLQELTGRVLFMDDEESICRMVKTLLERLGLSVTVVNDGLEVLREYTAAQQRGRPFDVVLMDLTVPGGMGGRETMEALMKVDPEVKAVVSSGYSSDPVLANHRAYGFRGRVAKPYRATDLLKTLREVLAEEEDRASII
jgi:PAS domain S-box-containing protein